ncbi:MAG: MFS superfamily sulfate permease-like transporter [Planctomycetota bacterium]|jgi:MFS superfamily sulfate permease-like transporter
MSHNTSVPIPTGRSGFAADIKAGFLVFLIALPLCLGIAMASGFPPIAGIMTAIVGGLLATPLGSARLTIKGPAAGLIVIALGAVLELGNGDMTLGYHRTLAVGSVAAGVQILFALLRTATLGIVMSPSIVHGMLAAIGVIIVGKQAHTVLGVTPASKEPLEQLLEIPHSLAHANPEILLVGLASLIVLFGWPFLRTRWAKATPAQLVVLLIAVPIGLWFDLPHAHDYDFLSGHYRVGPEFLVTLPGSLLDAIAFPDFSAIFSSASIKYIVMFALVGTIESTLSVVAVDSLDPEKRASNLNRDLLSVGAGNLACSLIGGLPMISEIVRSKANMDAGARTSRANFTHGVLLLGFVAIAPGLLHTIPLAALGAMLVYTGARLTAPSEFVHVRRIGMDQLLLFLTTLITTLATDLLIGVAAGLALKITLHFLRGARFRELFRAKVTVDVDGDTALLAIRGAAAFTTLLSVRRALASLPATARIIQLDLNEVVIIDHTFMTRVHAMIAELPGRELQIIGADDMLPSSPHPHASRRRIA